LVNVPNSLKKTGNYDNSSFGCSLNAAPACNSNHIRNWAFGYEQGKHSITEIKEQFLLAGYIPHEHRRGTRQVM